MTLQIITTTGCLTVFGIEVILLFVLIMAMLILPKFIQADGQQFKTMAISTLVTGILETFRKPVTGDGLVRCCFILHLHIDLIGMIV
jgi:hypothetical protein